MILAGIRRKKGPTVKLTAYRVEREAFPTKKALPRMMCVSHAVQEHTQMRKTLVVKHVLLEKDTLRTEHIAGFAKQANTPKEACA